MDRASVIYLDTHVLLRLCEGRTDLGPTARKAVEREPLLASPAAVLELEFLHEIGRLKVSASQVIAILEKDLDLRICDLPFRSVVERALGEKWGRDPFDRLIVANARARNAALATRDERILRHYPLAVW
jgi:PIN domain nuclease of toxin-antitoxin system